MCCASESSGSEKVWIREEGGYQDFPSNVFYLTVPNISVGGVFSVSFISLWKLLDKRGWGYQDFTSNF